MSTAHLQQSQLGYLHKTLNLTVVLVLIGQPRDLQMWETHHMQHSVAPVATSLQMEVC